MGGREGGREGGMEREGGALGRDRKGCGDVVWEGLWDPEQGGGNERGKRRIEMEKVRQKIQEDRRKGVDGGEAEPETGTVRDRTGIFPQSFVKIIKPLPESDSDGEGEGRVPGAQRGPPAGSYSCLRCYCHQGQDVETRDVCVEEELSTQPAYSELLTLMREVFKLEDIALNYRDPEGDLIRILDDEDVKLMVSEGRRHGFEVKRPVNQFPWELHVTMASDMSVYNTEF
ncbi:hypothetical protein JZ751_025310 [Albula glossodonta]|uniref:PB1 domain-containing protein n=1 Tax=Albula glossodonta TaxID=121402 RepID=A0A8T2NHW0_9TELE|nr:hypothetical protein JZ751_025310 [Albula glossodonta]